MQSCQIKFKFDLNMNSQPFSYAPDTFLLQLQGSVESFSILPYESSWGQTDEQLCYFEGVLIGLLLDHDTRANDSSTIAVALLPGLDRQREYEWPDASTFATAITALLTWTQQWELRCERDAEQSSVSLIDDQRFVIDALTHALSFCSGTSSTCPTFIGRGGAFVPNNTLQPTPLARLN